MTKMMVYQPWRVVEEGINDALICVMHVVYKKNKREQGSKKNKRKETGISVILRQRLLEPKYG